MVRRMAALMLAALCGWAAGALAQDARVYDRGTGYGVMRVLDEGGFAWTYFSGTPVELLDTRENEEGEIWADVRIAGVPGRVRLKNSHRQTPETALAAPDADVPCGLVPMVIKNPGGRGVCNLRTRASRQAASLGEYPNGTRVRVMGVTQESGAAAWAHVQLGERTGFMQLSLLAPDRGEAYARALAGTYAWLALRTSGANELSPFEPVPLEPQALCDAMAGWRAPAQSLEPEAYTRAFRAQNAEIEAYFAALGVALPPDTAHYLMDCAPQIIPLDAPLSGGRQAVLVGAENWHQFLFIRDEGGPWMLWDALTFFLPDRLRYAQLGDTVWIISDGAGGQLDGGRGSYTRWYNVAERTTDISFADSVEAYPCEDGGWPEGGARDALVCAAQSEWAATDDPACVTVRTAYTLTLMEGLYTDAPAAEREIGAFADEARYVYDPAVNRFMRQETK